MPWPPDERDGWDTRPDLPRCDHPLTRDPTRRCQRPAGWGTNHLGYGFCRHHLGSRLRVERAWEWAMRLAGELSVTPWEALLLEVRRAAWRCRWTDEQAADAAQQVQQLRHESNPTDGAFKEADQHLRRWTRESRLERAHLARVSKAAIDAGVAERLVRQVELEVSTTARVIRAGLAAIDLSWEDRQRVQEAMRAEIERVRADALEPVRVIDGELDL